MIDSRRSSVNSSDSSNLCYSSSPSPSTPARPCAVVSNQRVSVDLRRQQHLPSSLSFQQCYSPALQQQVAPFQCYLASPPSRSQSPIGMVTVISNNTNTSSSTKMTSFPPNLKRKRMSHSTGTMEPLVCVSEIDDLAAGYTGKKSRLASENESLFGPSNSP